MIKIWSKHVKIRYECKEERDLNFDIIKTKGKETF